MAVKKTQMYRKNLDTSETNLYPLTEAQYVSMENGQTVQEILSDRDSDKYTPVITNSSSTFKVGQGDNVDLSSSMKEGAYDSCVLKGKTMVNCIQEPSSQDVVLPYEFEEGRYVTINDTKESGALGVELKGQTLVNLAKVRTATAYNRCSEKNIAIKPNTKYIALFNPTYYEAENGVNYALLLVSSVSLNDSVVGGDDAYTKSVSEGRGSEYKPRKGDRHLIFTSKANETYLHIRTGGNNGILYTDMIVLEYQQGMENWDIPYFTGMTSCKMPILHTVGKNLFDGELEAGSLSEKTGTNETSSSRKRSINFIRVSPNTSYKFSVNGVVNAGRLFLYDQNKTFIRSVLAREFSSTQSNEHYMKFRIEQADMAQGENIQIEEGSTATSYENHKSSILSLPEEVVLRSLPNGVCDTFNTRTGVYTQRIKEIVFDGSNDEGWNVFTGDWVLENSTVFYTYISGVKGYTWSKYTGKEAISDKIPSYPDNWLRLNDVLGMTNDNTGARKQFRIPKSYLETDNVNGFRKWLEQNPVTACFELATPIITKVNLSSTLKSWNTTTHIYSEIPENSLYPILSHSNPTYPVILKPSTKYSIVANSYSNNHTNSAINFNLGGATASTTVGNRVTTITTPSTLSNELLTMSGRGNKLNNVMVIEGDVVGDEPYFEGICDCKSPILSNVGKNLVNVDRYTLSCGSGVALNGYEKTVIAKNIKVKPNTTYTFSYGNSVNIPSEVRLKVMTLTDVVNEDIHVNMYSHKNRIKEYSVSNGGMFTTESHARYIAITTGNFTTTGDILIEDIEIKEATSPTAYEPYKSNTTTFNQKNDKTIVLRSLPNGVCDTLNVETGEYVQRIGEVILTPEIINSANYGDDGNSKYLYFSNTNVIFPNRKGGQIVCDKIPYINTYGSFAPTFSITQNEGVVIFVFTSDFNASNNFTAKLNFVKEFASKNGNITIQYPLATQIVSTIDVQGFPYAYTSGHVQLSSGHSGQSLTPKVEYSLSANKTGQINSNTKRVSAHQKQLDDFEAMMLTSMVQSAYDKAILQFDYEMQMMSLGGE